MLKSFPDEVLDIGLREIHQMCFPAVGTAPQFPHNGQTLAFFGRTFQVVGEFQKTLQEPRLPIKPIVGQDRLGECRAGKMERKAETYRSRKERAPRHHRLLVIFVILKVYTQPDVDGQAVPT